jgi:single-strand DNA-binding protein
MSVPTINRVTIIGTIAAPAAVKQLPSGKSLTTIRVKTTAAYKDRAGAEQERVEEHAVVVWGERSVGALPVGTLVYIEGRVSSRSYESRGETRWASEIVGEKVVPLGGAEPAPPRRSATPAPSQPQAPPVDDSDVPF